MSWFKKKFKIIEIPNTNNDVISDFTKKLISFGLTNFIVVGNELITKTRVITFEK